MPGRIVVCDASILINLILVDRLGLLSRLPGLEFVVLDEVFDEVTRPEQRPALQAALDDGHLSRDSVCGPDELVVFVELRRLMGQGEAACLAVASLGRRRLTAGWPGLRWGKVRGAAGCFGPQPRAVREAALASARSGPPLTPYHPCLRPDRVHPVGSDLDWLVSPPRHPGILLGAPGPGGPSGRSPVPRGSGQVRAGLDFRARPRPLLRGSTSRN